LEEKFMRQLFGQMISRLTVIGAIFFVAAFGGCSLEKPTPAVVEFRLAQDTPAENLTEMIIEDFPNKIYIHPAVIVSNADVIAAEATTIQRSQPAVMLTFNPAGAQKLKECTRQNQGKRLAMLVDGKILNASIVSGHAQKKAYMTGKFTNAEAKSLAERIMIEPSK
jgi:preprotein translocase subunit SecD